MMQDFTLEGLFAFVDLAGKSTYASGKQPEPTSQRPNFKEYSFRQGSWSYRDSYTGFTRSAGQEIVWYYEKIVWAQSYCGGMTAGNENRADETYAFLKTALSQPKPGFISLRGPQQFTQGDWEYTYTQDGDITNYSGYEEIRFKHEVVFFHRAIGGLVQ